jgi:hypothetical protein
MTDCSQTAPCSSRVDALKQVSARDGVHFTIDGYKVMANNLISEAESMKRSDRQPTLLAKSHYWRGFKSLVGSCVLTGAHALRVRVVFQGQRGNRKAKPYHPYKRH